MDAERQTPPCLINILNHNLEVSLKVAIALLKLASGESMRMIGEMFGIFDSIVSKVVRRFLKSLITYEKTT
uniref:Transposase Helix-turn-helix domain-containing protein n=2 Tax=Physcomitrium patens TaxID=3218 RepID=A0A2K1J0K2_PHYPA|nr:hypothetical protein PHYPA_022955 [Physcomitrium patens]